MTYFMALSGKAGQPATFACAVADWWQARDLLASLYEVPTASMDVCLTDGAWIERENGMVKRWFRVEERDDDQAGFVLYSAGG